MSKQEDWGKVIYFLDGKCFGIAPNLQTGCLGSETDIKEMLINPDKRTGNPTIDGIIDLEIRLRKELENGQDTGRGVIRSSTPRAFQYNETNLKPASSAKRIALHKAGR